MTLSDIIDEIANKLKDYDHTRYREYDREESAFWEAVANILEPSAEIKNKYPNFYNFASNMDAEIHAHGLIQHHTKEITANANTGVSLKFLIPDIFKVIMYYGDGKAHIQEASFDKIMELSENTECIPPNTCYMNIGGLDLRAISSINTDIYIKYIEYPDRTDYTDSDDMEEVFSLPFIYKAIDLAVLFLKAENYLE